MPVSVEAPGAPTTAHTDGGRPASGAPLLIGLINNMPDAALQSTETQFQGLLETAAGSQRLRLRLASLPGLPRGAEAAERIARCYWPLEELLAAAPDALIVTGTEPRAARLSEEPYWARFESLLAYARQHTFGSIWSCLAAHAAVLSLDAIERRRLPEKRCGVYEHQILEGHPLLAGVAAPLNMPHSRWNELSAAQLRAAGYTLLSWSDESGADAFAREERSLLLFFQGHPEYEDTTLLKEYRRDVGRYLNQQQPHYPTLPRGYLPAPAEARLTAFREQALAQRDPALLTSFPFAAVAAELRNTWRPAALAIYRNWLAAIAAARTPKRTTETVSLARL